jgi:hypothetical protein
VNRLVNAVAGRACDDSRMSPPDRPRSLLRAVLALALPGLAACAPSPSVDADVAAMQDSMVEAMRARAQGAEVEGVGVVLRVLPDDTEGSPHQRFLLRLADGGTVLVAHNVALAPRLDGLSAGDSVGFRGEYAWNPKGGTVHWTHHDPRGTHPGGWLRWRGRTYR